MTEARANEIFKTKYPEGEIRRRHATSAENKYWVTFNPNGKVYYYSATSYAELLRRFEFNVIYKHDLSNAEANVERYQNKLDKFLKGEFDSFDLLFCTKEQALESAKESLADAQKTLQYYQNECIID